MLRLMNNFIVQDYDWSKVWTIPIQSPIATQLIYFLFEEKRITHLFLLLCVFFCFARESKAWTRPQNCNIFARCMHISTFYSILLGLFRFECFLFAINNKNWIMSFDVFNLKSINGVFAEFECFYLTSIIASKYDYISILSELWYQWCIALITSI